MSEAELAAEIRHLASKEDVANLRAELHKELGVQLRWIIGLQLPTWALIIAVLLKK